MTTPANRRMRWALVYLVGFGIALNAALLVLFAQAVNSANNEVTQTRSIICIFAVHVSAAAHHLPQVQGRVDAENAYGAMESRLHCRVPAAAPSLLTGSPPALP